MWLRGARLRSVRVSVSGVQRRRVRGWVRGIPRKVFSLGRAAAMDGTVPRSRPWASRLWMPKVLRRIWKRDVCAGVGWRGTMRVVCGFDERSQVCRIVSSRAGRFWVLECQDHAAACLDERVVDIALVVGKP